jgi:hypothetical protein
VNRDPARGSRPLLRQLHRPPRHLLVSSDPRQVPAALRRAAVWPVAGGVVQPRYIALPRECNQNVISERSLKQIGNGRSLRGLNLRPRSKKLGTNPASGHGFSLKGKSRCGQRPTRRYLSVACAHRRRRGTAAPEAGGRTRATPLSPAGRCCVSGCVTGSWRCRSTIMAFRLPLGNFFTELRGSSE